MEVMCEPMSLFFIEQQRVLIKWADQMRLSYLPTYLTLSK